MLRVAPLILLHVDGTVLRATVTALVQTYHWYRRVGVGYPTQVPLAVKLLPTVAVPKAVGFTVAVARASAMTTGTPLQVEPQPVAVYGRETEVRPLLLSKTAPPSVGAFPRKVTEVRALLANA